MPEGATRDGPAGSPGARPARMRADKWLVAARFFKTRSLAAALIGGGHLRVNGRRVLKPAHAIGAGDVLTFSQAGRIRVVSVRALAQRRGPASEAQDLYDDIPASPPAEGVAAQGRCPGGQP